MRIIQIESKDAHDLGELVGNLFDFGFVIHVKPDWIPGDLLIFVTKLECHCLPYLYKSNLCKLGTRFFRSYQKL